MAQMHLREPSLANGSTVVATELYFEFSIGIASQRRLDGCCRGVRLATNLGPSSEVNSGPLVEACWAIVVLRRFDGAGLERSGSPAPSSEIYQPVGLLLPFSMVLRKR